MSVDRPTFSESWHRVAGLRCRVRPGVRVVRQRYRGQTWHVLHDPAAAQYFRLNEPAYGFVGLLDGRRTVGEAWNIASDRMGDESPTQGEVVDVLGRMYTSNLLWGELPGDAQAVLSRTRKRVSREVQSYLMNLLFLRIPLIDPNAWLNRWHPLFSWLFTRFGLAMWVLLLLLGAWQLAGHERELASSLSGVLAPDNLFLLYVVFAGIKFFHEMAHAISCKVYGVREAGARAGAGEVRTMGVMLMVLMPVPYVDASSSWMLRSKARRVLVALAGMMAELAIAAIAAIVWANSTPGTLVNALAFNAMVTASVSTVVFNGNPLLRYDGYYVLCDLIETPNLAQRSADYVHYLVKRYIWGVKRAIDPSTTPGERRWFLAYWPASLVYRIFVFAGIILFVAQQWFIIGLVFALFGLVTWAVLPVSRFVRYLATNAELARVRGRAVATSMLAIGVLGVFVGLVPIGDHVRVEGVVEPTTLEIVHARTEGVVTAVTPSGKSADPASTTLLELRNPVHASREQELQAEADRLRVAYRQALDREPALAQQLSRQLQTVLEQIEYVRQDIAGLSVRTKLAGTWVSPSDESLPGSYAERGAKLGLVAPLDRLVVRAMATQDAAARLVRQQPSTAELRVKGRPDQLLVARLESILPAGQEQLPARALGYAAGGVIQTDPSDERGERTLEPFFEVRMRLDDNTPLLPGQRVVVRFHLGDRSIALQAWDELRRMLQRRLRF